MYDKIDGSGFGFVAPVLDSKVEPDRRFSCWNRNNFWAVKAVEKALNSIFSLTLGD